MPYSWKARYNDGTEYEQYGEEGEARASAAIDRKRLAGFALYGNNDEPVVDLTVTPGMQFVYRRRTRVSPGTATRVCHIVGWMNGSSKDLWFAFEDGVLVHRKDWVTEAEMEKNKGEAKGLGWFIEPQFHEWEK